VPDRDIVDRIDELVDEQLSRYDERSGYDYNVGIDKCPHCDGEWHGLPITEQVREMRAWYCGCEECATELAQYRANEDDSPIWRPGSEFIGPWANQAQLRRIREGVITAEWGPPPGAWTLDTFAVARSGMWSNPFLERREIRFTLTPAEVLENRLRSIQDVMRDVLNTAGLSWTPPPNPFATDPEPETEPQTPQERALPRPSNEPPMWAVQPNRQRRRRNR
jgi:hypothetical protein